MPPTLRKIKTVGKNSQIVRSLVYRRITRLFFLGVGLIFLLLGFYFSTSTYNRTDKSSITLKNQLPSVASEPIKIDTSFIESSQGQNKQKEPPERIIIPKLEIDLPVAEAKVVKGYWEVFTDSAGFGLGSSYPSDVTGNQVIFAHAREGLFLPLRGAKIGQKVIVLTSSKWYAYTISDIKEVSPTQTEVIAPTQDPILTLYTCSGFADSKRLIVTAKRD